MGGVLHEPKDTQDAQENRGLGCGRRQIVEAQQAGKSRAGYGEELIVNLSRALSAEYAPGAGTADR